MRVNYNGLPLHPQGVTVSLEMTVAEAQYLIDELKSLFEGRPNDYKLFIVIDGVSR